jgi:cytoskeleton protein RodZ
VTRPDRPAQGSVDDSPDVPIGATLAAARDARGLSIDDVARSTRIRGTLIREIEADRFTGCGGDVYTRGHIRNIAAAVGADGTALVAAYDRRHDSAVVPALGELFEPRAKRPERRSPNWAAAMAVALVAIFLLAAVDLVANVLGGKSAGPSARTTTASQARTTGTPAPAPAPPATAPPDAVAMVPQTAVSVRVRVSDEKCWVRVANGANTTLFQEVLNPGDTKDFRDPEQLRLTLGNAGAASLVVNGRDLGSPGTSGQVATMVFGRGDPAGPTSG